MRHLTDGDRDVLAELERDARNPAPPSPPGFEDGFGYDPFEPPLPPLECIPELADLVPPFDIDDPF